MSSIENRINQAQQAELESFHPELLLTTEQLARWFDVTAQSILTSCKTGDGPPYIRIAPKTIRYRCGDVVEWLKSRRHLSTTEY
jgi:hypothetical protein